MYLLYSVPLHEPLLEAVTCGRTKEGPDVGTGSVVKHIQRVMGQEYASTLMKEEGNNVKHTVLEDDRHPHAFITELNVSADMSLTALILSLRKCFIVKNVLCKTSSLFVSLG